MRSIQVSCFSTIEAVFSRVPTYPVEVPFAFPIPFLWPIFLPILLRPSSLAPSYVFSSTPLLCPTQLLPGIARLRARSLLWPLSPGLPASFDKRPPSHAPCTSFLPPVPYSSSLPSFLACHFFSLNECRCLGQSSGKFISRPIAEHQADSRCILQREHCSDHADPGRQQSPPPPPPPAPIRSEFRPITAEQAG